MTCWDHTDVNNITCSCNNNRTHAWNIDILCRYTQQASLVGVAREVEAEACALRGKSVGGAMLLDVSLTLELWVEISAWEECSLLPWQSVHSHIPKQNGELEQTAIVDSLSFFLLAGKLSVVAKCLVVRAAPQLRLTNQMGYIKVKAQLPGIYGNVNCPCPRATPSDSGRFYCHKSRATGL